jgi:hypothetical protein
MDFEYSNNGLNNIELSEDGWSNQNEEESYIEPTN